MIVLNGISASPGIVIGRVFLFLDDNLILPRNAIAAADLQREIRRFQRAVEASAGDLKALKAALTASAASPEQIAFVDAHLMMLQDPEFLGEVEQTLTSELKNAETALYQTGRKMIALLEQADDVYLKERSQDIADVTQRILSHLMAKARTSLQGLTEAAVVVGKNLLPSDTLSMDKSKVMAIAMEMGGKTSHTAILARSFEIPAVLGLARLTSVAKSGDCIIVDGGAGKVILNPNEKTLTDYQHKIGRYQTHEQQLAALKSLPAQTRDGKSVCLAANIEVADEVETALSYGAMGIGLFRSEFLMMRPGMAADEEAQYAEYAKVVERMEGKPVTIRTLDIGGDKSIPYLSNESEENPILGCRSIRFCLTVPQLFKTQLKALLRAGCRGNLRIMFPMICGVSELDQTLALLQEAKDELSAAGVPFRSDLPVGVMIEVPSAALISDVLAQKVDFFSIGTNDLIQYTVAVDRGNEKVAYLYNPYHLSVLRLIQTVVRNAHKANIPVSICGEMAGDSYTTVLLLGLGLDSLSMTGSSIAQVKQIIRSVRLDEAADFAGQVMQLSGAIEIEHFVRRWMNEHFPFLGV